MGNLTFVWVAWGKLNLKCKVSNDFFFGGEVKVEAEVINTFLDEVNIPGYHYSSS